MSDHRFIPRWNMLKAQPGAGLFPAPSAPPLPPATASLSGKVFLDSGSATAANTNNGVPDFGEAGFGGVTMTLAGTDITGAAVSRTTTTSTTTPLGNYTFSGLVQSNAAGYTITRGALPASATTYVTGQTAAGTAGGTPAGNAISAVVLGAGVTATGYNFAQLRAPAVTYPPVVVTFESGESYANLGLSVAVGSFALFNYTDFNTTAAGPAPANNGLRFGVLPGTVAVIQLLDPATNAVGAGGKYGTLTVSYLGGPFKMTVYGKGGGSFAIPIDSLSGFGRWVTSTWRIFDTTSGPLPEDAIDRVVFDSTQSNGGMGFDNITFSM